MSFSQLQQDQWVVGYHTWWDNGCPVEKFGGYFVEVGSHNGLHHSNTLLLEKEYGWHGILIEANELLYKESLKNRPDCINVNALVDGAASKCGRFMVGQNGSASYSGIPQYFPDGWHEEHEKHGSTLVEMPTFSLPSLLKASGAPSHIDYLSLDVEGAELPILENFIEDGRYSFQCMTVEFRYDQLLLEKIEQLLFPEYKLDEVRAFDACFVKV